MFDTGLIWGYLLGRYEDGIAGVLTRLNRRTRGGLAAFVIGFCLALIPSTFLFSGGWIAWAALGVAVGAVLLTWIVQALIASRRIHGTTMRLRPNHPLHLTATARPRKMDN